MIMPLVMTYIGADDVHELMGGMFISLLVGFSVVGGGSMLALNVGVTIDGTVGLVS